MNIWLDARPYIEKYANANPALQKQPPGAFYEKSCSYKVRNIDRKIPVLDSPFNKVAGLHFYLKGDSNTGVFLSVLRNF